ncbi:MAG: ribosomal protein S18 acetylase RimI-like enzyme [Mariniblastus sp.]|jgi:ribosomal protein S18 acetylase RimI-like enzyme
MLYRSFLNTDPPLIVDIWRRQAPIRSQVSAVTRGILDHHVFSKPYFDAAGLILAFADDGETPLGFVHAGFDVNSELSDLNKSVGIISQLKVIAGDDSSHVANGLVAQAIKYLTTRGCQEVYCGSRFPNAPFYLGLYGGSQIPGILVEDEHAVTALQHAGFEVYDKIVIMERRLAGFRTVVDREQMALRRRYQINAVADPLESSWWESCTVGMAERDRFSVYDKSNQTVCGNVSFWDVQPLANHWGVLARGMYELNVPQNLRRGGIATFLVGEALRNLMQQGVGIVEAQTRESDQAAIGVFRKLGFEDVSHGLLMSKRV